MAGANGTFLDVGCGSNKQHGWTGLDCRELEGVDIVHDAETFPWPLKDGSCANVMMAHFIEHIKPWLQFALMDEVWRITEAGGQLMIVTPYGMSPRYFQDPTHCAPWTEVTPLYFDPEPVLRGQRVISDLYSVYEPKPWRIIRLFYAQNGDIEVAFEKRSERS